MYMNMEDPFPRRAAVIDRLHRARDGIAPDPGADSGVIDVLIVRNRLIPRKKDQPPLTRQRSHPAKDKADPFRGERVRPAKSWRIFPCSDPVSLISIFIFPL